MNPNRFLVALLFAVLGCTDREEELLPHIVSIDRNFRQIDPALLGNYWSREAKDNNVIVLDRGGFQTITVTFSSPPSNLEMKLHDRSGSVLDAQDYILHGAALKIKLYCTLYIQGTYNTLTIDWSGGDGINSTVSIPVWCPFEDPPAKEDR